MYIKVATVKVKRKRYAYVRVVERQTTDYVWNKKEVVIATLGTLERVQHNIDNLITGLERLKTYKLSARLKSRPEQPAAHVGTDKN